MPARTASQLQTLLAAHAADIEAILRTYADDDADRDDLRQEIAIAVWKAMPRFQGRSSERTYILRIAHNRGVSFRMRVVRNRAVFEPIVDEPAVVEANSGEHEIDRLHASLAAAMTQLPAPQHELLTLAASGYTAGQIASLTGRTSGAVRVALHRARETVRRLLGRSE